jgi:hypothetical protein
VIGAFDAAELSILAGEADEEILAGLAHRFEAPEEIALGEDGLPFIGHVLAATVVDAALRELPIELERIVRNATVKRRRQRIFSSNPFVGQLDLGRISLARPELDLWPILKSRQTHNTPENALILATLKVVSDWGARHASRYAGWSGSDLFSRAARVSGELSRRVRTALGDLSLAEIGPAQLLPLATERLALKQAERHVYGRALELIGILLTLVDPRRQVARVPDRDWVVAATVGGLNEAGLQHTAFELWVASRIIAVSRSSGFEIDFPHAAGQPLARGQKGSEEIEVWWQSPRALLDWPSPLEHERHHPDGEWRPLVLKPDLVVVHRQGEDLRVLCVECKNKRQDIADSKDLAQAFGYLSHYAALEWCGLVYRSLGRVELFRRIPSSQGLLALGAPVAPGDSAGSTLMAMVGL